MKPADLNTRSATMIMLYNQESSEQLGAINDEDFQFLQTSLEEESVEDDTYYIDEATIELLRGSGASESLLGMLSRAVGGSGGCEVQWREAGE